MPTVIRKSKESRMDYRREVLHAVSWQIRPNSWSPPTDVFETEETFIIRMEIAGMREEDFEVTLINNTLLIAGSRVDLPERRAYHQMEIRFGKFATGVELSGPVNVDEALAEYKDGFLTITLPKARPNQIKVE